MQILFFCKNMTEEEEIRLKEYFLIKTPTIEKMLTHYPADAVNLQVKGEKFDKHSAFNVELVLKMPGETLSAREASHLITKAVDLAKDRLSMQLKKSTVKERRTHRGIRARGKVTQRTRQGAILM